MNHGGMDSSYCAADCEDYSYFLSKLHVAYSNADAIGQEELEHKLRQEGEDDPAKGAAALCAIAKAARSYSAFPVACSTYDASAHGDVVVGCGKHAYTTHTTFFLIPERTINRLKDPKYTPTGPGEPKIKLIEGTALVSSPGDSLTVSRNGPGTLDKDIKAKAYASLHGLDATFPVALNESHFYAYVNQLIHDGNGYICTTRSDDKLGVPFDEFISDPAASCHLEAMYPEPSLAEKEANRRFLVGRCPVFRLQSPSARAIGQRAIASSSSAKTRIPRMPSYRGGWGIIRGVIANSHSDTDSTPLAHLTAPSGAKAFMSKTLHIDTELSLNFEPVARGLGLVIYT